MPTSLPALAPFGVATLVLSLNLLFLWGFSGSSRARTKTTMNPEDARSVSKGAKVVEADPETVARWLRAHANAQANILPTLALALVFVLYGGPAQHAWILLGVFAVARWLHSLAYILALQPWRTLSFVIGGLATLAFVGYDAKLVLTTL